MNMKPQTAQTFPKPTRRLRLGMVGGGHGSLIGAVHASGARLSGRWDIVAGALSSNPERAHMSGRDWLIDSERCYVDFQDMARCEAQRQDGIDAVAIVTPNYLHAPVAHAFMEQGIHIISDKPLTAQPDEIAPLLDAYKASGVIYGVTYVYASHVMVRQAREMVLSGMIGEVRQVHVEYLQDWAINIGNTNFESDAAIPWRFDPERNGKSLTVADIGTHAEHLVRFVTNLEIEALRAEFYVTGASKSMEDTAFITLRLKEKATQNVSKTLPGTLIVSQAMAGAQCGLRIRVSGTKAGLEWFQEAPETLSYRPIGEPEQMISRGHGAGMHPSTERLVRMKRGHPEALSDAWANLYTELGVAIEAHRLGRSLPPELVAFPTIEDGVHGMYFVDAALRSSISQNWETLVPQNPEPFQNSDSF